MASGIASALNEPGMKLTLKLTLAFLFVSLLAVGLAAVFVWVATSFEFNRYLLDQRRGQFVGIVIDYYQTHGKWQGVDQVLRQQGLVPPGAPPGGPVAPAAQPQPFVLVDEHQVVIIPGGTLSPGQKVPADVLGQGVPITVDGRVVGTVVTSGQTPIRTPLEEQYLAGINRSLLIAALGAALIALLLGIFLARTLTHPVRDLTAATQAMARGELGQQVPVRSQDELGELAASFNQMSVDLARANQARRQMTADIAHDLRNPLTVVAGYIESLRDGVLKPSPERFATMTVEIEHLEHLVEDLRTLSLADAGELVLRRQPIAPRELLERLALAYQHQAAQKKINLVVEAAAGLPEISIDPERMEQVLGNLVSNALRYTPEGGEIRLVAGQERGGIALTVQDTGSGIPPEILPHIFERSYRGDPSRSGDESGLGLAIAKSIVELHGGKIGASSAGPSRGSRFWIVLPAYAGE